MKAIVNILDDNGRLIKCSIVYPYSRAETDVSTVYEFRFRVGAEKELTGLKSDNLVLDEDALMRIDDEKFRNRTDDK